MSTLVVKNLKTFFSLLFISAGLGAASWHAYIFLIRCVCVVGERGWIKVGEE